MPYKNYLPVSAFREMKRVFFSSKKSDLNELKHTECVEFYAEQMPLRASDSSAKINSENGWKCD